jgi:hypothetical protein
VDGMENEIASRQFAAWASYLEAIVVQVSIL